MKIRWMRQFLMALALLAFGGFAACGDDTKDSVDATGDTSADGDTSEVTCQLDSECDDDDACNGEETCSAAGVCVAGTALSCTASDACHEAECNPSVGCEETLIDVDGDGFASESLGACGTDCDDASKDIAPGNEEICDGIDNNCDPSDDDGAVRWYVDCDGDGFSEALEASELNCDEAGPAEDHDLCNGSGSPWVTDLADTDCCLLDDRYYPESEEYISELKVLGEVFACQDYDSNCDDTEELRYTTKNTGGAGCVFGQNIACSGASGWTGNTVPDCGEAADFSSCVSFANVCNRITVSNKRQECR